MPSPEVLQAFWNSRASLGATAGTQDRILKRLEIDEIARHVKPGMTILDVGCGTGETAIELADRFGVEVFGFDYAPALVEAAQAGAPKGCTFVRGDLVGPEDPCAGRAFDLVYTERCLINLPDWETQRAAIRRIAAWVKRGGRYLMIESSQDALERLNGLRASVGLPGIAPPWHNRYLVNTELNTVGGGPLWYVDEMPFSETYYFLSRVVNAALAAKAGTDPDYDAPVNKLALELPGDLVPDVGQTRAWLWERR